MSRFTLKKIALQWLVLATLMVLATPAVAQQQDPLRIIYINIGEHPARASHATIDDLLDATPQVDLIPGGQLLRAAQQYDMDLELLEPHIRNDSEDELAALMWDSSVEGILIHDVSSDRSQLQITIVGPRGWIMGEVTHPLDAGNLDDGAAMTVLQDVFSMLVPEVRGFRRDVEEGRLSAADFEMPHQVSAPADDLVSVEPSEEDLIDDPIAEADDMGRQITLRAGLLAGHRSMGLSQPEGEGFAMNHTTMLIGPALRVDGLLATFADDTMAVEVGGVAVFAPFYTGFDGVRLSGQFFQFGADVRYLNFQVEDIAFRGILGIQTLNITMGENPRYTGHGYMYGRLGGGAKYTVPELVSVQADLLFMPILQSSNSALAYGEASGLLGAAAEVGAILHLLEPIALGFDYSFHYFQQAYPEPRIIEGAAQTTDFFHQVMITAGYNLGF